MTNSFSRPKNPQTQPGPGTIKALICPVQGSNSMSPTNPSLLQSQILMTSRLFSSHIRIKSPAYRLLLLTAYAPQLILFQKPIKRILQSGRYMLQPVFKVSVRTIDGSHRIMGKNTVLGHQRGHHGIRIAVKQGIMTHTESQGHIELRLLLI